MKKTALIFSVLLAICFYVNCQNDHNCNAIQVLKKGKALKERKYMNTFSKRGFNLYENYCYSFIFKDERQVFGRIIKILNDTLYITNSFNEATAAKQNIVYDTLKYSIQNIKTLQLNTEKIGGYTRNIDIDKYNLQLITTFECHDESVKVFVSKEQEQTIKRDTLLKVSSFSFYVSATKPNIGEEEKNCYLFLTNNGVTVIYEMDGDVHELLNLKLEE